jgi:glutamate-1-semialdehyde 2,1-aminomutase
MGERLMSGLKQAAFDTDQNMLIQGLGPMFHTGFTRLEKVTDYRDVLSYDKQKLSRFIANMHDKGIRIISRGLWYISGVHTEKDIDDTIDIAYNVLKKL